MATMRNMRMDGRTVVIVGASSGVGRGAALRLAQLGANVVAFARRGDVLDELVAEIRADGGSAVAVPGDISSASDIAMLAEAAVEEFHRIDVWINDVGVGSVGSFWAVPLPEHVRVAEVNLVGFMHGAHTALRLFLEQGRGTLVNLASVESEVPLAYHSSYAATKAAVLSLTRTLHQELRLAGRSKDIKVCAILPWALDTPWWSHAGNHTGHAPRMLGMEGPDHVVDAIVMACLRPRLLRAVGWKAKGARLAYRVAPRLAVRLSADIARIEMGKGMPAPDTAGALHQPVSAGVGVEGGVRERMRDEDGAP
jgi:short-subunit dehydrogenase